MPGPWHLGNDIVDLTYPRALGKASEARFLRRVFSEYEREVILASDQPDLVLCVHWAAKEAAFKSVSKARGEPPVFHHPSFRVSLSAFGNAGSGGPPGYLLPAVVSGEVYHEDARLALRVRIAEGGVHALTWVEPTSGESLSYIWEHQRTESDPEGWRDRMGGLFSDGEWTCVTHQASALTRLGARKALASALAEPESALEIGCDPGLPGRRIPRVFLRGAEIPVDLTLSHHGSLQAWAFVPL